jgi:hypothetical protein
VEVIGNDYESTETYTFPSLYDDISLDIISLVLVKHLPRQGAPDLPATLVPYIKRWHRPRLSSFQQVVGQYYEKAVSCGHIQVRSGPSPPPCLHLLQ